MHESFIKGSYQRAEKMIDLPDMLGILGATMSIYCYARVQWKRDYAKNIGFSFWNFVGTVLILVSLAYHWNMALFVSNIVWAFVSLYGVYRCLRYRWLEKKAETARIPINDAPG
jgi:hypothetical protein